MTIITWEYWEERASISRAEMRLSGGPHRLECRGAAAAPAGVVWSPSRFDVLLMETSAASDNQCQGSERGGFRFYAVLFTDIVKANI